MIPRVHAPDAPADGGNLEVPPDEAHWLREVLRLGPGARVRVFDGRGAEWEAVIAVSSKRRVSVALEARRAVTPEPRVVYTLALPVLKGNATEAIVRDAVMMGVARLRPFLSARTEASIAAVQRGRRHTRWQRVAVASAKQSGRATVPAVDDVVSFDRLVNDGRDGPRLIFVEPGVSGAQAVTEIPAPAAALLATGPEGGWSPDEVTRAVSAGWQTVRLGPRVLRAEAAPLAALAACQAVWKDL